MPCHPQVLIVLSYTSLVVVLQILNCPIFHIQTVKITSRLPKLFSVHYTECSLNFPQRKPILLIPYLIYSIFKAVGMIPVVEKFYSRKDDIIATLKDIGTGYESASRGFGFVNPENPDQNQVTVDLIKYAVYAILSLLVALMSKSEG